jgi:plastocyanin
MSPSYESTVWSCDHANFARGHQIEASRSAAAFIPADLTVNVGGTVTIFRADGAGLSHNSNYDDVATSCPLTPTATAWSCPRTFTAVGDYSFHCDLHQTMIGTIHVVAPPGGGGVGGGGRGGTATTPGGEIVKLRLGLSRKARAAVRRALAAGRKPTAKLRITATDTAGNRTVETRRIRLRG